MMPQSIEILRGVVHPWYCDNFGHMNVRWYSHFFDDAAFHLWPLYWGSHQKMLDEFGVHTVTASATIQFLQELVAGDLIIVDSLLTGIGNKSCTFTQRMVHVDTEKVHATYQTTEVFFDPQTRKSTKIPAPIRQAMENAQQLGERQSKCNGSPERNRQTYMGSVTIQPVLQFRSSRSPGR